MIRPRKIVVPARELLLTIFIPKPETTKDSKMACGGGSSPSLSLSTEAPEENGPMAQFSGRMSSEPYARRLQFMSAEADMSISDNSSRLVYTSKKITDDAFSVFEELRQLKQLCDVTICVSDHEFVAHRAVLAATSPYFRGMFTGQFEPRNGYPETTIYL